MSINRRLLVLVRRVALLPIAALLAFSASPAPAPLVVQPSHANGIYARGESVEWTITPAPDARAISGPCSYTIKRDGLEVIQSGSIQVPLTGARIEAGPTGPATLYLEVTPPEANAKPVVGGAAVAPEELQPCVPRPADFDEFWRSKIELLQRVPMEPVVTPGDSGRPDIEYATIKLNNIRGAHVYGQLAKPARPGKYPAMLLLQWASAPYPLQKSWVTDRAAEGWLVLNVEPHDVPCDLPAAFYAALPQLIKEYRLVYDDNRDRNYFLQMYLGDYRAVDYLVGRPDWDGRTLVVTGTSMGGQQSLCVAGLHPKVTHVVVHEPAGSDTNAALHRRAESYPNWDTANPRVMETALYFDPVNFAPRITARCLISVGLLDRTATPTGIWTMFNQIRGPKEIVPLFSPHNNLATEEQQRPYLDRARQWLGQLARGEQPVPRS